MMAAATSKVKAINSLTLLAKTPSFDIITFKLPQLPPPSDKTSRPEPFENK
ncbi:MAG: hypothetical protein Q7T88_05030 [Methylotenera sp.]|nr:hypothetical protein [Methylotenera sp.]